MDDGRMINVCEKRTGRVIPSEKRLLREMRYLRTYDEVKALCEEKDYSYYFTVEPDDTIRLHVPALIGH